MSPGRRPNAADGAGGDRVFIEPAARRQAMLDVIAGARERLVLSLFRCNDFTVLDALAAALERGVKVEAILTSAGQRRQEAAAQAVGDARGDGRSGASLRRSRRQVPREVPRRRRQDGARRHAQPDQEVLHAHARRRADDRRAGRGAIAADAVRARCGRRAGAAAPPHQLAADRRTRRRAGAHARAASPARATASASSITSCRIPISSRCCANGATRASSCRWSAGSRPGRSCRTAS